MFCIQGNKQFQNETDSTILALTLLEIQDIITGSESWSFFYRLTKIYGLKFDNFTAVNL